MSLLSPWPSSRLLSLPDELKLEIVRWIDQRRDLLNLCLTCHMLEDVAMFKLYTNVQVEIPQLKRKPGMWMDYLSSVRTSCDQCIDSPRSESGSVDVYISDILARIPANQLESFSYLHKSPLTLGLLGTLTAVHGNRLLELRIFELDVPWKINNIAPQRLSVLECRSIQDGEALGRMVHSSKDTLEVLRLGQEKELMASYRQSRIGFLNQITQPVDSFISVMRLQEFPKLKELSFFGLDISIFVPESIPNAMFFYGLERLTLESCSGSAEFLDSIASTFHGARSLVPDLQQKPRLKEFCFRHEALSTYLKDCLNRFLSSFAGLERLSLLFENATFLGRCSTLINEHGPTLEKMVLECRIQPREHLGLDTSRPFGVGGYSQTLWEESISDICRLCPNLVELGMGFPWNDDMVRIRKKSLPRLGHLRTIHVRNFPESQCLSQLGDYSIKEYANKFVEWNFPALVGGARPALETLSIGPTLYESRWLSSESRRQPPEYARTHHFCLDWAKTRFGRWSALITSVTERCMEEVRGESPLAGVFEQVWLR